MSGKQSLSGFTEYFIDSMGGRHIFVNVILNFSVKCYTRIIEYRNSLQKGYFSELRYIESILRELLCLNMHSQKCSINTSANKARNFLKSSTCVFISPLLLVDL